MSIFGQSGGCSAFPTAVTGKVRAAVVVSAVGRAWWGTSGTAQKRQQCGCQRGRACRLTVHPGMYSCNSVCILILQLQLKSTTQNMASQARGVFQ